jgi:hypothetical protein
VPVPVMDIGKVWVSVSQRRVRVLMRVGLGRRRARRMLVLVVLVVPVQVRVLQGFMEMLVLVTLARVQPDSQRHQRSGGDQSRRHRLAQDEDAGGRADKWRR